MHHHQLVTDKQAAALLSISRSTWWRKFVRPGRVSVVKLGQHCTRFKLIDIEVLLQAAS